jgi:hypothetical protein
MKIFTISIQTITCSNQTVCTVRCAVGDKLVCFLIKLLKEAGSSNPSANAISATLYRECLSSCTPS